MATSYDLILVGSGFASAMFLARYLEKTPRDVQARRAQVVALYDPYVTPCYDPFAVDQGERP